MRILQPQRLVALRSYKGEKGRTQLEKKTLSYGPISSSLFYVLYTEEREKEALDRRKVFADFSTAFIISLTGK